MNKALLKSYMVKNNDTQEKLAAFLGVSLSGLNAQINGKSARSMRIDDARKIKERYGLDPDEMDQIFFAPEVS